MHFTIARFDCRVLYARIQYTILIGFLLFFPLANHIYPIPRYIYPHHSKPSPSACSAAVLSMLSHHTHQVAYMRILLFNCPPYRLRLSPKWSDGTRVKVHQQSVHSRVRKCCLPLCRKGSINYMQVYRCFCRVLRVYKSRLECRYVPFCKYGESKQGQYRQVVLVAVYKSMNSLEKDPQIPSLYSSTYRYLVSGALDEIPPPPPTPSFNSLTVSASALAPFLPAAVFPKWFLKSRL